MAINSLIDSFFYNGIIPLTPEKTSVATSSPVQSGPPAPLLTTPAAASASPPSSPATASGGAPPDHPHLLANQDSQPDHVPAHQNSESWTAGKAELFLDFKANYDLVRRHSISLTNRTPPHQSLASDIMNSCQSRTKLVVNEIRDLTDRLSDFNSCISSSESSEDADNDVEQDDKTGGTMNDRKRKKRNKRKHSLTPNKDFFLKKQNTADTAC
jgi:hypothetical protein